MNKSAIVVFDSESSPQMTNDVNLVYRTYMKPGDDDNAQQFGSLISALNDGFNQYYKLQSRSLQIAREYGPKLLELKSLIAHGKFQHAIAEIFPFVSYDTCLRWMNIAKQETTVAQTLTDYPDVNWGLVNMLNYLNGNFDPTNPIDRSSDESFEDVSDDTESDSIEDADANAEPNGWEHLEEGSVEKSEPSRAVDKPSKKNQLKTGKVSHRKDKPATCDMSFFLGLYTKMNVVEAHRDKVQEYLSVPDNMKLIFKHLECVLGISIISVDVKDLTVAEVSDGNDKQDFIVDLDFEDAHEAGSEDRSRYSKAIGHENPDSVAAENDPDLGSDNAEDDGSEDCPVESDDADVTDIDADENDEDESDDIDADEDDEDDLGEADPDENDDDLRDYDRIRRSFRLSDDQASNDFDLESLLK